jgi:hypothetical protein
MALRRLLSGWLIAMAALARSLAQALERASEDRSATTPDPVMAALAERYPGAPAHWLAHVAERTSQLAETGEAPLSLNSDPAAWPSPRPDGSASPLATPAEPEPAARDPRRPAPPLRHESAVPTLAALRDRSSEVWRRPDVERPRRPRPVFAAVTSAPTPERPATPAPGATPRRPRSPLTFIGSPPQAVSNTPEPGTPASDTAATAPPRDTAWSEPTPTRAAASDAAKAWTEAQRSTQRPPIDHAFARARPEDAPDDKPETRSDRVDAPPVARRQRSWFFARSASGRLGRPLDLSNDPGRRAESGANPAATIAVDPTPALRAPVSFQTPDRPLDRQVAAPDRVWRALTPPTSRRSLFRMLAALRARPRGPVEHLQASEPALASAAATTARPPPRSGQERPALAFTASRARLSTRTAPVFPAVERDEPPSPDEDQKPRRVAHRVVRPASSTPTGETHAQDKRSAFAAPRRTPSRPASRGFAASPPDDRWPALPPTTFASPNGVEAFPPRWDQLAREQEEGRWSV